jgi:hypothetical protein
VQQLKDELDGCRADYDKLRDAMEKEQSTSYNLLQEAHKTNSDNKLFHNQLDDKEREAVRQAGRLRELELENEKLRKDNDFLLQRTDQDISKLQSYLD